MRESKAIKQFASDSKELYTTWNDYKNQYLATARNVKGLSFSDKSLSDKDAVITKLFVSEVAKRSGVSYEGEVDKVHFANNPMVRFYADEIKDRMIDMILPDILNTSVGMVADIQYLDWGDTGKFDIKNNALFTVGKAGYRNRNTLAQRLENQTVTLAPVNHELTVISNMFNVLTGRDTIGEYLVKVALSIEAEMLNEIWGAFEAAFTAVTVPSAFKVTNFAETTATQLAQRVSAWNRSPAAFIGTTVALGKILPSETRYRFFLNDEPWKIGYVKDFRGYDVIETKNYADYKSNDYDMVLSDSNIYVVSPAVDKMVKVCVGGSLSHTEDGFFNANLSQVGTVTKAWDSAVVTNAVAGVITV